MLKCRKLLLVILAMTLFLFIFSVKANAVSSNITFDAEYYLNNYNDLRNAFGTNYQAAYDHFMQYGIKEGRTASMVFDVRVYINTYPDLKSAFGTNYQAAYDHFVQCGIKEGRISSDSFDVKSYIDNYSDLRNAFGNNYEAAYEHFVQYGIKEGRTTAHNHSYTAKVTAPTQTSEGYTTYNCSCGDSYISDYVPALESNIENKEEVKPDSSSNSVPSVTPENGQNSTPSVDTQTNSDNTVNDENVVPPTNNGPEVKTPEHVHSFTDWVITTPSTCNKYGEKQRSCQCGYVQKERLTTLGAHVYQDTYEVEATCTERGRLYSICTVCHGDFFKLTSQALGHDYSQEVTEPATCQKEGASYTKCSRCDSKIDVKTLNKIGHNYQEKIVTIATCTTDGLKATECTMCKKILTTEIIPRKGHNFVNYTPYKEAACEQDATEIAICENGCGATDIRSIPGTMKHHDFEEDIVEPTCLQDGKSVKTCRNCDYTVTQILPQTGHRWIDKETIESTCTGSQTTCECEYCHIVTTFTNNFAGTGHTWADPDGSKDFVGNYCTKCGKKAPNWTNDWAVNVYRPLFEEIWEKEHNGEKYGGALPDIYTLSEEGLKEFRERIAESEGGNRIRIVWYVGFYADKTKCAGLDGERDGYILKTVITADWKFEVTAPEAKPGYEFKGWINKVTGEKVEDSTTIVTTWRDKDKTFEAVYEHI